MKILLLGEFSGFNKNLKEGLIELGHECEVAGVRDGFKRIPVDIDLDSNYSGIIGKFEKRFKLISNLSKFKGYDVVQLINPFNLYYKFFPNNYFIDKVINSNKKFFLSGAGSDAFYWKFGRELMEYGPFEDYLKYDLKKEKSYLQNKSSYDFNKKILDKSNGIIPIMYDYEISYSKESKILSTIPIPINTDNIKFYENKINEKLVVFHGLNRYGFKGTRYVEEAFSILNKKYPNDLELIIDGQMSLDKYLKVMNKANCVIDQTSSYSTGINGLSAMAMGKVVLGGAEKESLQSYGLKSSPIINIKPNAMSIVKEVEKLLDRKNEIPFLGQISREHIENVHCYKKVAQTYINTWSTN